MRKTIQQSIVTDGHQDFELLAGLERTILQGAEGLDNLLADFPLMMRRIIDNVVDTPRTGRRVYEDLEKTEKTYIGTRVEIELRAYLGFPKGKLDLLIDGLDVDVKHTMGDTWMIPTEAINKPCIVVAADEGSALCYLGLIIARPEYLTASANKDSKKSVSAAGCQHIKWLVNASPYPANFWRNIDEANVDAIFGGKSGNKRLVTLFKLLQEQPIPRDVVDGVAQQKDYMKRLRANGGARDELKKQGISLFSGAYDAATIKALGLPFCKRNEFISTNKSLLR